jgi:hypothetical protein
VYLKERLFSVSGRPTAEFFLRTASAVTTGLRRNRSATGEGLRAFEKAVEFTRCGPYTNKIYYMNTVMYFEPLDMNPKQLIIFKLYFGYILPRMNLSKMNVRA